MRVAPRSVRVAVTVSARIASLSAAVDSTGAVQVMSPTVRKRTLISSTTSPGLAGVSSVMGASTPPRRTTARLCA